MNKTIPGFRQVPRTGVIYVMHRAAEMGYRAEDPAWVNLGQGAPETNALEGAPARIQQLSIDPSEHEYGPVTGQRALRQKVADLYNSLYRQNKKSQYTWENVSICGGGRVALTRIVAALGNINLGHFLPDYTAYEELLSIFKAFIPIPILLEPELHYQVPLDQIKKEILGRGLKALLMSNPCNPTGQLLKDEALQEWVRLAREYRCSLILDEFYSHYIYEHSGSSSLKTVSSAEFVEDVDQDPIIIVDGLTKNWRYPGWRISWTIAPKEVIHAIASAGSFLDGGANNPFQKEIIKLLDANYVHQEATALQNCFLRKRNYVLDRLLNMGIQVEVMPQGAFYIWANLSALPEPLNDGIAFFEAGLKEKVITVPGVFFDVNPEKRRTYARYRQYARISFGPEMEHLERGLDALERVIANASKTIL
ncbi:MAG: aspartate aminotransferase [Gammaproteobacteria bacterium 39-13]|nr:pyridoxal phosphate-dependent aminotransferase [Gammaproteobacteria bacterium]OJV87011.1 MAG: aspartate aminotransferase [Gammaproteobacteria bacterium 39-13]